MSKRKNKTSRKKKEKQKEKSGSKSDQIIKKLQKLPFKHNTPNIESMSPTLFYEFSNDLGLKDKNAYNDTEVHQELEILQQLSQQTTSGKELITMLYTHRGIALSISNSKNETKDKRYDDSNTMKEFHEINKELLEPLFDKAENIFNFGTDTVEQTTSLIRRILNKEIPIFTSNLKKYLTELLDSYIVLDLLIANKSSFSNDFTHYKRECSINQEQDLEQTTRLQRMHEISMFLANKYSLTSNLKTELIKINGFEQPLIDLINYLVHRYQEQIYFTTAEKHQILRTIVIILILLDQKDEKNNVFNMKGVPIKKIGKFIKWTPCILYCGDMAMKLEELLLQSYHFNQNPNIFSNVDEKKVQEKYLLTSHIEKERENHNKYLSFLYNTLNILNIKDKLKKKMYHNERKEIIEMIVRGFRLISNWSTMVIEQLAWKYTHPNTSKKLSKETSGYERVVRYNYTNKEKAILIEFISMIKGLSSILTSKEGYLAPIIRMYLYENIQEFAQNTIRPIVKRSSKKQKKKKKVFETIMFLRTVLADWDEGKEPKDAAVMGKSYKGTFTYKTKQVGICQSLFTLIPSLLETYYDEKAEGMKGGFRKEKNFKNTEVKILQDFVSQMWSWKYLLEYSKTIIQTTDLGIMWYREFNLALNQKVQFPIEMSLPWILTKYALSMKTSHVTELMLYPLSLYNDAADSALYVFRQQFLYDEIEAEIDLCFEQLTFTLTEEIFSHYKKVAAILLLETQYKKEMKAVNPNLKFVPPKSRYSVLMKQRHFHLLGRVVNLTELLTQRLNNVFRENIDWAIRKFESSEISGIIELDFQLQNIKLAHELLSEHLFLDSYDSMYKEVNQSMSLKSLQGRVIVHCIYEFIEDLATNFVYNSITQRFIRSQLTFVDEVQRAKMGKVPELFQFGDTELTDLYDEIFELYRGFIGTTHIATILRIVNEDNLPLIAQECLTSVELKIQNVLAPYVEELLTAIYTKTALPSMDNYGIDGCFGGFELSLNDLREYSELESKVYQNFRELGNTIILMYLFEQAMPQLKVKTFINSAPFLCVIPKDEFNQRAKIALKREASSSKQKKNKKKNEEQEIDENSNEYQDKKSKLIEKMKTKNKKKSLTKVVEKLMGSIQSFGIQKSENLLKDLIISCEKTEVLYKTNEKPISLFTATLLHVNKMLDPVREKWLGNRENGLPNIELSNEFYRLWSALQFLFCLKISEKDIKEFKKQNKLSQDKTWVYDVLLLTNQETYGDGFAWAGATIIHFLGQREMFDALDYSYHIMNANEALEEKAVKKDHIFFLKGTQRMKELNDMIFGILTSYAPLKDPVVFEFDPPTREQLNNLSKTKMMK
ncbi:cytoplasmic fmr1-interacting protein-related [Anaeramoeba flamelloides]|uniref:Cytoplasmic fmr1-interacting protein-related n=1 Tax=Anaeramoeba flamelloides TaxID=1746091 RepID=A0AAV8AAS8_9EUKA|nr:cytoplasmic fmr1-interacting protein-related [Anaeramoeba flamelloides]